MRLLSLLVALALSAVGAFAVRADAADPFGSDACPGVRPGAVMQDPAQNLYTMGFFFNGVKGRDKGVYFGTVGDLVLASPGTRKWSGTSGPAVRDANGKQVGHFVYAFRVDTPAADSFGLVRLNKRVKWSAGVCHFGGPTGAFTATTPTPFEVNLYGHSLGLGDLLPARSAVATGASDPDQVTIIGPAQAFATGLGDDGAPVLAGGKAVGFLSVAVSLGTQNGIQVRRVKPLVTKTQKATGIKLTLLTSKVL